jgi:hypothetical protein
VSPCVQRSSRDRARRRSPKFMTMGSRLGRSAARGSRRPPRRTFDGNRAFRAVVDEFGFLGKHLAGDAVENGREKTR